MEKGKKIANRQKKFIIYMIKKQYFRIMKEAIKNIPGNPDLFQFLSGWPWTLLPFFLITFYLRGAGLFNQSYDKKQKSFG